MCIIALSLYDLYYLATWLPVEIENEKMRRINEMSSHTSEVDR